MTYEVTATRKRPRLFDELAGQEFVVSTLKSSIASGRIAHAYLFSGPRGVGKTSAARILAKALNCEKGPTDTPCGECASCMEIARGGSLDVIEIDGASNTSVNDVREIKDEVLFAPNSSRYKVYIIDEVHMLSNSAFNALLKTIEEPPPYIVFVFATTEIHKVPATIRSRCQQFNFRLIPVETIKGLLGKVCAEMRVRAEDGALSWIAREATGSLRDAYTLLDQILSFSGSEITLANLSKTLGLAGFDRVREIVEACAAGEGERVIALVDETLAAGVPVEQVAIELSEYFRSLLFLRHGIVQESLLGYPAERFSGMALEHLTVSQLEQAVSLLLELYRNLRYSLSERLELELVLSRLAALAGYLTPREILDQVQQLRRELGGGAPTTPGGGSPAAARPSAAPIRAAATVSGPAVAPATPAAGEAGRLPTPSATRARAAAPAANGARDSGPVSGERRAPATESAPPAGRGVQSLATPPMQHRPILADEDDEPDGDGWDETTDAEGELDLPAEPRTLPPGTAVAAPTGEGSPVDGLRTRVMEALKRGKRLALSSALESSLDWRLAEDSLTILFAAGYHATKVREELQAVLEAVEQALGRKLPVHVEVKGAKGASARGPRDEQIELVKRVFRGEVIKGGDA